MNFFSNPNFSFKQEQTESEDELKQFFNNLNKENQLDMENIKDAFDKILTNRRIITKMRKT